MVVYAHKCLHKQCGFKAQRSMFDCCDELEDEFRVTDLRKGAPAFVYWIIGDPVV